MRCNMLARRSFSALAEPCLRRASAPQRWVPGLMQVSPSEEGKFQGNGLADNRLYPRLIRDFTLYRTVKK